MRVYQHPSKRQVFCPFRGPCPTLSMPRLCGFMEHTILPPHDSIAAGLSRAGRGKAAPTGQHLVWWAVPTLHPEETARHRGQGGLRNKPHPEPLPSPRCKEGLPSFPPPLRQKARPLPILSTARLCGFVEQTFLPHTVRRGRVSCGAKRIRSIPVLLRAASVATGHPPAQAPPRPRHPRYPP